MRAASRVPEAGDHFVHDEDGSVLRGEFSEALHVRFGVQVVTVEEDTRYIALRQLLLDHREVVEGHDDHVFLNARRYSPGVIDAERGPVVCK